jgi:glycosyltransferase involved in cell wall biosynthesis
MRVAFLLNNDCVYDARVKREAIALSKNGYEVTIFCIQTQIEGVPQLETHGRLTVHRLFPKSLKTFKPFTSRQLQSLVQVLCLRNKRFDIVHAHDSSTLLLGWALSRIWKVPLIYDSHELWESVFEFEAALLQSSAASWINIRRKLWALDKAKQLETWLLRRCNALISVNDSLCRILSQKADNRIPYVVPVRNISSYYSLPKKPERLFHKRFALPEEARILLYQGDIKQTRGIEQLLDMMEKLSHPDVVLVLMGTVPEPDYKAHLLERIEASSRLQNRVFLKSRVPTDELLQWTASADVGLAPILNARASYYYCLPNKLFEYIQAEIPCVTSNFPEMKRIVEDYQVGLTFDPEQPATLLEQIERFLAEPQLARQYSLNARRAKMELCWEQEQRKLLGLYQQLLKVSPLNIRDTMVECPVNNDLRVQHVDCP